MPDPEDRDFGGIRVTRADWPMVVIEFPEKRVEDSAFQAMLANNEALMLEARSRGEKLFFISDLTRMREVTPASQRKYAAQSVEGTFDLARASAVGAAHVTPSTLLRGLFTAVFWIYRPPMPAVFVATRDEAIEHGTQMLEAAGQRLPARLAAHRWSARQAERLW